MIFRTPFVAEAEGSCGKDGLEKPPDIDITASKNLRACFVSEPPTSNQRTLEHAQGHAARRGNGRPDLAKNA